MDYVFIDSGMMVVIGIAVALALLGFIAKIVLVVWAVRSGLRAHLQHQRLFDEEFARMQHALQGSQLNKAPDVAALRMAWERANAELAQMQDLRRQQSELRIAQVKSQAAEVGIFL